MAFLEWFFGRRPAQPPPQEVKGPVARSVMIEWRDEAGELQGQPAKLIVDDGGKMTATVAFAPPGELAQIREMSSSYPVAIVSKRAIPTGIELKLDFLFEGRRRETRMVAGGQALVEGEGGSSLDAEVLNVSSGGMQVLMREALRPGSTARVRGNKLERTGLVRYCDEAPGGYRVGLQFYGDIGVEKR